MGKVNEYLENLSDEELQQQKINSYVLHRSFLMLTVFSLVVSAFIPYVFIVFVASSGFTIISSMFRDDLRAEQKARRWFRYKGNRHGKK